MGHQEVREFLDTFAASWPRDAAYYVWGASNTARKICALLENRQNIIGFVDNNPEKWGTEFQGRPVLSPDEFFRKREGSQCIVASMAYGEISQDLERHGMIENVDFCNSWYFWGVHHYLNTRQVHLYRVDLSVTSYCNLRCRHCNMLMPYYERRRHYPAGAVLADVDAYFRWVAHVDQLNILGGEPFLHPDIGKITAEIAARYRSQINDLVFFSNGTVIPDEQLLHLMSRYQIRVDIGDYRKGVPGIQPKVDSFIQTLERHGIAYSLPLSDTWLDFNHTPEDRGDWDAEQLAAVRERCREPFRGIHDQKLYFCHLNASAGLAGLYPTEPGDYFDLSGSADTEKSGELLAFDLACFPKGYVSYCRHCGGCGPANRQSVPAAEQLPAGYRGRP